MANPAYIESLTGGLEPPVKLAFKRCFDYVLRNLRLGPVVHQTRVENLQAYYLTGTTPAVADQEFSLAHGLARVPYLLIPVLGLDTVGQQIVPLRVSRAADESRIYLRSTAVSAAIAVMVE
jgi:hypothetical protein